MALHHAVPGEIIDIRPLGESLHKNVSATLLKSEHLQVFRLILPVGKEFREHQVPGEITVQCLEGRIEFSVGDQTHEMAAGELLYLNGGEPHALKGLEDASVLVTVFLQPKQK